MGPERARSTDMGQGLRYNRVKINSLGIDKPLLVHYVVLAAHHIIPDIHNARDSEFEIDENTGGISVNQYLETKEGVFVAGNSASWCSGSLERRRSNVCDHARKSGNVAGHNMSCKGEKLVYDFQPGFRSYLPLVDVEVDGFGIIDSNLKTVGIWQSNVDDAWSETSALSKGIVYYIHEDATAGDRIVGCLLWNNQNHIEEARKLLSKKESCTFSGILDLKNKIQFSEPASLNIMVEKKKVPTFAEIKTSIIDLHPKAKKSTYF